MRILITVIWSITLAVWWLGVAVFHGFVAVLWCSLAIAQMILYAMKREDRSREHELRERLRATEQHRDSWQALATEVMTTVTVQAGRTDVSVIQRGVRPRRPIQNSHSRLQEPRKAQKGPQSQGSTRGGSQMAPVTHQPRLSESDAD